jgi:hypothetical protein
MSRGTRCYTVRISDGLRSEIDRLIARRRRSTTRPPLTFAEMIRMGLEELVDLDERRRRAAGRASDRKRGRKGESADDQEAIAESSESAGQ